MSDRCESGVARGEQLASQQLNPCTAPGCGGVRRHPPGCRQGAGVTNTANSLRVVAPLWHHASSRKRRRASETCNAGKGCTDVATRDMASAAPVHEKRLGTSRRVSVLPALNDSDLQWQDAIKRDWSPLVKLSKKKVQNKTNMGCKSRHGVIQQYATKYNQIIKL